MEKKKVIETIVRLASKIGADPRNLPTFENTQYDGRPNIEFLGQYFQYAIQERNTALKSDLFTDLNGLLYQVFKDITFQMAMDDEVAHRVPGVDSRRLIFTKQLELLKELNSDWSKRVEKEQVDQLSVFPFNDTI